MPLVRINATGRGVALHGAAQSVSTTLEQARRGRGPVVIMVHGYKYSPALPARCPHARIFHTQGWPSGLGLGQGDTLGVAFGWHARGGLARAYATALEQARNLAQVIAALRGRRPVHIIAHSLGATLALAALPYLRAGDVGRIVLLSGAAHLGLARHALDTPAGHNSDLYHVTSGENALFDLGFERLVSGSGSIARGIMRPNALQLHIDCSDTLVRLADFGYPLGTPQRRICHWSSYTRAGVMAFNAALLRGEWSMDELKSALPLQPAAPCTTSFILRAKTRILQVKQIGKRANHGHAY